jgi:hypothetical protein
MDLFTTIAIITVVCFVFAGGAYLGEKYLENKDV